MDHSVDGFEETELGRIVGLGYGSLIGLGIVLTDKRIIRIDYRGKTTRMLTRIITGAILWGFTSAAMIVFLFTILQGYTLVAALILFPLFIFIIPRKIGKETTPGTTSIPREKIVRIEFKKPGLATGRGKFGVKLANGESVDFWSP